VDAKLELCTDIGGSISDNGVELILRVHFSRFSEESGKEKKGKKTARYHITFDAIARLSPATWKRMNAGVTYKENRSWDGGR